MLVKSNYDGRRVVPIVANTEALIAKGKAVVLDEGWNEIDDNVWPVVEPILEDLIKTGEIELYCKEEVDKDTGITHRIPQALHEIRSDRVRPIIQNCFNIPNLERWMKDVKLTSEIRNAVDIQLQSCIDGVDKGSRAR